MGVQACLWTEYVDTPEMAEYMILPRMCALSEIAWSPKEKKDFGYFTEKMITQYDRLGQLGANYRWPKLEGFNKRTQFMGSTEVAFTTQQIVVEIRYTTDGSVPNINSTLYKSPFTISESTTVKLIQISPKMKISPVYTANYIKVEPRESINITGNKSGLKYQYFELEKDLRSSKELNGMIPVSEGTTANISYLFPNEKLTEKLTKKFGLIYKGFIEVPTEAIYYFGVSSYDGSRLSVSNQLIINDDKRHSAYEKTEGIALKPGFHEIKLEYFQKGTPFAIELQVFISSEKIEKTEITAAMLSH